MQLEVTFDYNQHKDLFVSTIWVIRNDVKKLLGKRTSAYDSDLSIITLGDSFSKTELDEVVSYVLDEEGDDVLDFESIKTLRLIIERIPAYHMSRKNKEDLNAMELRLDEEKDIAIAEGLNKYEDDKQKFEMYANSNQFKAWLALTMTNYSEEYGMIIDPTIELDLYDVLTDLALTNVKKYGIDNYDEVIIDIINPIFDYAFRHQLQVIGYKDIAKAYKSIKKSKLTYESMQETISELLNKEIKRYRRG